MDTLKLNDLQRLRITKGYSYQKMAMILNMSKPYYWQLENGKRRLSYINAFKIAKIFNKKPDEVFYTDFYNCH